MHILIAVRAGISPPSVPAAVPNVVFVIARPAIGVVAAPLVAPAVLANVKVVIAAIAFRAAAKSVSSSIAAGVRIVVSVSGPVFLAASAARIHRARGQIPMVGSEAVSLTLLRSSSTAVRRLLAAQAHEARAV